MNRFELIREVGVRSGFRQEDIETVINATLAIIHDTLLRGEDVQLRPSGKLTVVKRPARRRFIPNIQEHKVSIPKYSVEFVTATDMKNELRAKYAADFPDEVAAASQGEILGSDIKVGGDA